MSASIHTEEPAAVASELLLALRKGTPSPPNPTPTATTAASITRGKRKHLEISTSCAVPAGPGVWEMRTPGEYVDSGVKRAAVARPVPMHMAVPHSVAPHMRVPVSMPTSYELYMQRPHHGVPHSMVVASHIPGEGYVNEAPMPHMGYGIPVTSAGAPVDPRMVAGHIPAGGVEGFAYYHPTTPTSVSVAVAIPPPPSPQVEYSVRAPVHPVHHHQPQGFAEVKPRHIPVVKSEPRPQPQQPQPRPLSVSAAPATSTTSGGRVCDSKAPRKKTKSWSRRRIPVKAPPKPQEDELPSLKELESVKKARQANEDALFDALMNHTIKRQVHAKPPRPVAAPAPAPAPARGRGPRASAPATRVPTLGRSALSKALRASLVSRAVVASARKA